MFQIAYAIHFRRHGQAQQRGWTKFNQSSAQSVASCRSLGREAASDNKEIVKLIYQCI